MEEEVCMPSITVKNIPDHAYEILKQVASTHHRSINSEIIRLTSTLIRIDPPVLT